VPTARFSSTTPEVARWSLRSAADTDRSEVAAGAASLAAVEDGSALFKTASSLQQQMTANSISSDQTTQMKSRANIRRANGRERGLCQFFEPNRCVDTVSEVLAFGDGVTKQSHTLTTHKTDKGLKKGGCEEA
jgi:hypothetical protein